VMVAVALIINNALAVAEIRFDAVCGVRQADTALRRLHFRSIVCTAARRFNPCPSLLCSSTAHHTRYTIKNRKKKKKELAQSMSSIDVSRTYNRLPRLHSI
jgi:hypothetical protein